MKSLRSLDVTLSHQNRSSILERIPVNLEHLFMRLSTSSLGNEAFPIELVPLAKMTNLKTLSLPFTVADRAIDDSAAPGDDNAQAAGRQLDKIVQFLPPQLKENLAQVYISTDTFRGARSSVLLSAFLFLRSTSPARSSFFLALLQRHGIDSHLPEHGSTAFEQIINPGFSFFFGSLPKLPHLLEAGADFCHRSALPTVDTLATPSYGTAFHLSTYSYRCEEFLSAVRWDHVGLDDLRTVPDGFTPLHFISRADRWKSLANTLLQHFPGLLTDRNNSVGQAALTRLHSQCALLAIYQVAKVTSFCLHRYPDAVKESGAKLFVAAFWLYSHQIPNGRFKTSACVPNLRDLFGIFAAAQPDGESALLQQLADSAGTHSRAARMLCGISVMLPNCLKTVVEMTSSTAKSAALSFLAQIADKVDNFKEVVQLLLDHGADINYGHKGFSGPLGDHSSDDDIHPLAYAELEDADSPEPVDSEDDMNSAFWELSPLACLCRSSSPIGGRATGEGNGWERFFDLFFFLADRGGLLKKRQHTVSIFDIMPVGHAFVHNLSPQLVSRLAIWFLDRNLLADCVKLLLEHLRRKEIVLDPSVQEAILQLHEAVSNVPAPPRYSELKVLLP